MLSWNPAELERLAERVCKLVIAAVLLLIFICPPAHAGARQYTGSLSYLSFGNDTTTGATQKLQTDEYVGFPFGHNCNVGPMHPAEVVTFPTTPYGTEAISFTIPAYGGQALIVDTNGDGLGDRAAGCGDETRATGAPLIGQGASITTTGLPSTTRTAGDPRGINIPAGRFTRVEAGIYSGSSYGRYRWSVPYIDVANEPGVFRAGSGAGLVAWAETLDGVGRGALVVSPGSNRFGGTMKLLGAIETNTGNESFGILSVGVQPWLFENHGGGGLTLDGEVTALGLVTGYNALFTTLAGASYTQSVFGRFLSWTTGTVSVTAIHGPFPTVLARHGFDNRNAAGSGEIQMVTPMVTRWVWLEGNYETASIGKLRLTLLPEPPEVALLGAGLAVLALLYRGRVS